MYRYVSTYTYTSFAEHMYKHEDNTGYVTLSYVYIFVKRKLITKHT